MDKEHLKWVLNQFHFFMVSFDQGGMTPFWLACSRTEAYRSFLSRVNNLGLSKWYSMDRLELFHQMSESLSLIRDICSRTIGDIEFEPKVLGYLFFLLGLKESAPSHLPVSSDNTHSQKSMDKVVQDTAHPALMAMRTLSLSLVCEVQYKCTLPDLFERAKDGDDTALFQLIRLDPAVLSIPFASRLLALKSITCDDAFFTELTRAIRPDPGFFDMRNRRNQYALHLLASFGFIDLPYRDWADFFAEFHSTYCADESTLKTFGFETYEDESTLAKACKRYGVPKIHASKRRKMDT